MYGQRPALHEIKAASSGAIKNQIMSNKELAEELRKPIIRKLKKRNVFSFFIYSIWDAGLAEMQLAHLIKEFFIMCYCYFQ